MLQYSWTDFIQMNKQTDEYTVKNKYTNNDNE